MEVVGELLAAVLLLEDAVQVGGAVDEITGFSIFGGLLIVFA